MVKKYENTFEKPRWVWKILTLTSYDHFSRVFFARIFRGIMRRHGNLQPDNLGNRLMINISVTPQSRVDGRQIIFWLLNNDWYLDFTDDKILVLLSQQLPPFSQTFFDMLSSLMLEMFQLIFRVEIYTNVPKVKPCSVLYIMFYNLYSMP